MEKRVLNLNFLDILGKKFKLTVNDPKEDLTQEVVRPAMEAIISADVFAESGDLESVESAVVVVTTEEQLV